jgi:hypothetical protein
VIASCYDNCPPPLCQAFLRAVTGLLLPAVLAETFKKIFLDESMFRWRLGVPFVDQLVELAGNRAVRALS